MSSIASTTRIGAAASATAGTTLAVTVTGGILAGDDVFVVCATVGTAIQSPTDNASGTSNVYIPISPLITNTNSIQMWACYNARAATVVTMNNTSSRHACCVACYTGGSLIGRIADTTGSGLSLSLATVQGASDSWIITGFAHEGTGTFSSSTGTLRESIAGSGSTTPGCAIVDNHGSSGSSITCSCSNSGSTAWTAVSAELLTAPGFDMSPGRDCELARHWVEENVTY